MASLSSMSSRSNAAAKAISAHAQAGRVVRELHVAAEAARLVVERLAHDAEVLLGGEGAAVALGGGAVRDVVEERLRGGADHRDDVGAGLRRGARLLDVVVDVPGGDDDVLVRPRARSRARRCSALRGSHAPAQLVGRGARLAAHLARAAPRPRPAASGAGPRRQARRSARRLRRGRARPAASRSRATRPRPARAARARAARPP